MVALSWVLTRFMIVALMMTRYEVTGSLRYYWRELQAQPQAGLAGTLTEYPTPVVWVLSLPHLLAEGNRTAYLVLFVGLMLVVDAIFTWSLWRADGRRRGPGVTFWVLFVLCIGQLSYLRFDLLPAVLVGAAVLTAARRPMVTGALIALGAGIKIWPAMLAAGLAARRRGRGRLVVGFIAVGAGLALASLMAGGLRRLLSPLAWQSGRGLQIESVMATPVMVARAIQPERWTVRRSAFQAYEVFGPSVGVILTIGTFTTALAVVAIGALLVRAYRNPDAPMEGIGFLVLAIVGLVIASNKTLSPQYILWLGGAAAAVLSITAQHPEGERRPVRRLSLQLLALAALTQLVYPVSYGSLLAHSGHFLLFAATGLLALRNLLLVWFTIIACVAAWRALGRVQADLVA